MNKHLLLIGGGHAHMVTLARLQSFVDRGVDVTVIQPSEYHYYSGMGPGMLGGTYEPDDIRFATRRIVENKGGRFILGRAWRIDPYRQVVVIEDSEEEIHYDVLSCNAGSYVPREMIGSQASGVYTAKPIEQLLEARQKIAELAAAGPITVAVVGSGPSAIEIAGNVCQLCARLKVRGAARVKLFAGREFMAGGHPKVRRLARMLLEKKGVEINTAGYVKQINDGRIRLEKGDKHQADIVFPSVGVRPSPIFARSGLPIGPDGGLQVNEYLQSIRYDNIFGGGDCIHFEKRPLDKVGVYAVRQNPVLYHNLMARLQGRSLSRFSPGGKYLLIYNLGDGEGVFAKWSVAFAGKLAFVIKDWIDRRFIRTFQEAQGS